MANLIFRGVGALIVATVFAQTLDMSPIAGAVLAGGLFWLTVK